MKNKLSDLNNVLFEEIERLSDESLTKEELMAEIQRGRAISAMANTIISAGQLAISAQRMFDEFRGNVRVEFPLLETRGEQ